MNIPLGQQAQPPKRPIATIILGDRNTSAIASTATGETLAVEVTFNSGMEMIVEGFQVLFNGNIEPALVRIYDTMRNRDLVSGNTQLGTIGYKRGTVLLQPYVKIRPLSLRTGQSIQLRITNVTGLNIATGELGLTLFGCQYV
jgi:hypothetical protein